MSEIPESHPDLEPYYEEVRSVLERDTERERFPSLGTGDPTLRSAFTGTRHFERGVHIYPDGRWVWFAQDQTWRRIYSTVIHDVWDWEPC